MSEPNTAAAQGAKGPRPYMDPYLAGALLGVVLFLTFFVTGGGLGASAALSHVQTGVLRWFAPAHVDRTGYFAELAGGQRDPWNHYSIFMLLGTIAGGFLSGLANRRLQFTTWRGPNVTVKTRWATALLGGFIMAYGARLARGCTSGQALSGGAVLSVGSWAFMFSIVASGYALAWFVRRLWT
jgi:hypothetical protein